MNLKADFFTKRIDSHNESIQIANWNALVAWSSSGGVVIRYVPTLFMTDATFAHYEH